MRNRIIFSILSLTFLMGSCEKEIAFNGDYSGEKLVIYSCATAGDTLKAEVYKSRFFLAQDGSDVRNMLEDATVSAEVNGTTYPFRVETRSCWQLEGDTPVRRSQRCYVSDYVVAEGDKIVLRCSKEGLAEAWGEVRVPTAPKVEIESYSLLSIDDEESYFKGYEITFGISLDDPAQSSDFYRIEVLNAKDCGEEYGGELYQACRFYSKDIAFEYDENPDLLNSILGYENISYFPAYFKDSLFDGTKYEFDIVGTVSTYDDFYYDWDMMPYSEDVVAINNYRIEVCAVSRDEYLYSKSVQIATDGGLSDMFGEPAAIHNNVINGIGCISARAKRVIKAAQ